MIKRLLSLIGNDSNAQREIDEYRALIRREAELGGQLFGPVPAGRRREFFCLDAHTWIWHEEWVDQTGAPQTKTTRYDIRPTGILKAQGNGQYHLVDTGEARNLIEAARIYIQRTLGELYGVQPPAL